MRRFIPRKEYSVKRYVENREEYVIEELYYLLNISIWHFYIGEDGNLGTPFSDYFAAKKFKEQKEKEETKNFINRELKVIWTVTLLLVCAVFGGMIKYVL